MSGGSRWRRRGQVAVLAGLFDLMLFNAYQIVAVRDRFPDFDFFYAFTRSALAEGFHHVYDMDVQRRWDQLLFPGSPYLPVVNPPPFAWVLTPLALLPAGVALLIWTVGMVSAIAVASQLAAPPGRYWRVLYLGSWLGFLAAYVVFTSAPLAPLIMLSLVVAWKLLGHDRQVAAGLVLAIGLLKPTVAILVPVTLLAIGYRRTFFTWLAVAASAVAASCAVLGADGIRSYVALSTNFASGPYFLRWSLVPLVGEGLPWVIAVVAITAAVVWTAWRIKDRRLEAAMALGVVGSILINHHMTPGDLMLFLVPVWLLLRERRGVAWDVFLGCAWVGGWLALIFPPVAVLTAGSVVVVLLARSFYEEGALVFGPQTAAGRTTGSV